MTSPKPAIVVVPGAWHKVSQFAPLTTRLEKAGYDVHGVDYPSTAPQPTNTTIEADVKKISAAIESLADQGQDVVLVVHSASGIVACEAANGLLKTERQQNGKPGGICHIVFLAAFVAAAGNTLWGLANGPLEWEIIDEFTSVCSRPEELFYNECSPEQAKENAAQLEPIAKAVFMATMTCTPWKDVACTYLLCENDQAIPPVVQEGMSSQEGANFNVIRCKSDHSPFLCMPDFTAKVVREAAGESVDL